MTDDPDAGRMLTDGGSLLAKLLVPFGPYAFSLINVLLIWYAIMNPILDKQKVDFQRHETILDKQREVLMILSQCAQMNERTSLTLLEVAKRLEK